MASTLPNLTFLQRPLVVPATGNTIAGVIAAINAEMANSTYWEIKGSSGADFIMIGPKSGSNVPALRFLIAGDGTGPDAAQIRTPYNKIANCLYVGMSPDSDITVLPNVWNSASNPFGAQRFSEYGKVLLPTTDAVASFWILESQETFSIWFHESGPDDIRGFYGGASIAPPDDADGEGTPGRVYAIAWSGTALISSDTCSNVNTFFGSSASNTSVSHGAFRPSVPATFDDVDKHSLLASGNGSPRMNTNGGSSVFCPILFIQEGTPNNYAGHLRQAGYYQEYRARTIIQNSDSTDRGFLVGSRLNGDNEDSVLFYNLP